MAKSAIVSVRIVGDPSSGINALNKMGYKVKGFESQHSAAFGAIAGVAQSMTSKAISAISGLSGEMISSSDSAQQFANTLKFSGIDDKTIKQLTASTQAYADKTVYNLSEVRNTTAQLASNGVANYAQLTEAAGNLNAVAGGNANTFSSVAQVLTQTNGVGKLTAENFNQLSDAIPGASGQIIKALQDAGAYTGNFRDAMSQGQISAEEFNNAILKLGQNDAAKKAAEDSSQFGNAAGQLQAGVVKTGAALLDMVKPQATQFITDIGNAFSSVADVISSEAFTNGVTAFSNGLSTAAQVAIPFGIAIGGSVVAVRTLYGVMEAGSIIGFIRNLGLVTTAQQTWTAVTNIARNAQAMFNLVLEANPLILVVTLLAAVAAGLVYFFTQTEIGRNAWATFTSFLTSAITSAGQWISNTWNNVVNSFRNGVNGIKSFFSGIGNAISAPFRSAFSSIRSWWNNSIGGKGFDVPSWIPGVGGKSFRIPMLANGGTLLTAGTVMVGEAGPELLRLPAGAQVIPLNRTRYNVGNNGTTINITVNGALDPDNVARQIKSLLSDYDDRRN